MSFTSIITFIVFAGIAVFTRVTGLVIHKTNSKPEVQGQQQTIQNTPAPSPSTSASPKIYIKPTGEPIPSSPSSKSQINIKIDSDIGNNSGHIELIYPGANKIKSEGNVNYYETGDSGSKVYDWYKGELGKRSFQIRNNVRAQANDKFKGELQAVNSNTAIKISITQENSAAKTQITVE